MIHASVLQIMDIFMRAAAVGTLEKLPESDPFCVRGHCVEPADALNLLRNALCEWNANDETLEVRGFTPEFGKSAHDDDMFYASIMRMDCYLDPYEEATPTARLVTLLIPQQWRGQRMCAEVVEVIRAWAAGQSLDALVGPVIEESMHRAMERMNTLWKKRPGSFDYEPIGARQARENYVLEGARNDIDLSE